MTQEQPGARPAIVGDVVFGGAGSRVAVCTLSSRRLLPQLAGRPEIAIAGRVFTENIGVERMVQNLVASPRIRYLIVCGRESPHAVGQTIFALHKNGLDPSGRVVGSRAPEPLLPNLTAEQLQAFQRRIRLIDMIGTEDAEAIVARAAELLGADVADEPLPDAAPPGARSPGPEVIVASSSPAEAWRHDPTGFFLVFVERAEQRLRVEQYGQDRRLVRIFEGRTAEALCHTIIRHEQVSLLEHAAYLGRELAKAETALRLGLDYEQEVSLRRGSGDDGP